VRVKRVAAVAVALLSFGCNETKPEGAAARPSAKDSAVAVATAADDAKQIATNRCAMCHGTAGKGDGPTSATLNPKPRDFSSKDWQKSMSDGQIRTVILQGGVGVGKSPLMPPNPDLADKPAVVEELVKIVRAYGR
jgi:cytochrome c551/c552